MRDTRGRMGRKENRGQGDRDVKSWTMTAFLLIILVLAHYLAVRWWFGFGQGKTVSTDSSICNYQALLDWGLHRGITLNKVTVGVFKFEDTTVAADYWLESIREKRGLMALHDIDRGEAVVIIPWETCMTPQHLRDSSPSHPLTQLAQTEERTLEAMEILALWLLYEYYNPSSDWAPYLCLLPRKLSSSLFWGNERMERLEVKPLLCFWYACWAVCDSTIEIVEIGW